MARKSKEQQYSEAELIGMFGLKRLVGADKSGLMQEWTNAKTTLSSSEHDLFEQILNDAVQNIDGWHEEDLKMKFISFVLRLGYLNDSEKFRTYFEKTIAATLDGVFLKTRTDFMVAKGILDMPQIPYFHFQEYKPQLNPTGEPMAQVLEAFLIAISKNNNTNPLYGCEVVGKQWKFVVMENRTYCISKSYDCTEKDDLMQIIAILRKFKEILETRLLD